MKTSKRILTAVLSSALSAIMLFGSTTTALAVENNTVAVSSSYNPVSADLGVIDEDLKAKLATIDDDDTVVVVYKCNVKTVTDGFMEIDEFAESLGRGDEVEFNEEENIFYATDEIIELYQEYEKTQSQILRDNAKDVQDIVAENYSESLLHFDIHTLEIHVSATKSEIESFAEAKNKDGYFYADKISLGNQSYYNEEYGLTWEDYDKMTTGMVEMMSEQDQISYDKGDFFFHFVLDYFDGECMFYSTAFKNDGEIFFIRTDNKYVYSYRDHGGSYLFYDDGVLKNPAQMYAEDKITLDGFYTFGALLGDVNIDKKVDVTDVTYLQMHLAGYVHTFDNNGETVTYPYIDTENQSSVVLSDINNDSKIDVTDVTTLQMMLTGYELNFEQ